MYLLGFGEVFRGGDVEVPSIVPANREPGSDSCTRQRAGCNLKPIWELSAVR